MSKTAIVTGASSGIGYAITEKLLQEGHTVYGLSRSVTPATFSHAGWIPVECDLLDEHEIGQACDRLLKATNKQIDLLVLCAGKARFGPHETHQPEQITEMVDLNFKAPLLLVNRLLRALRDSEGHIIGIGSVSGKINSPQGGVYAATKAGFQHFLHLMFDETRKQGVRITRIVPDLTMTPFYDDMNFEPENHPDTSLAPGDVADAVLYAVNTSGVVTELEIRPQKLGIRKK